MKYVFIDRYTEMRRGESSSAVKNIPFSEDLYPACSLERRFPSAFLIEAMAQTAGMLIGYSHDFERKTVFSKVESARFHREVEPGESLRLTARLKERMGSTYRTEMAAHVGEECVARMVAFLTGLDLTSEEGKEFATPEFTRARESNTRELGVLELTGE